MSTPALLVFDHQMTFHIQWDGGLQGLGLNLADALSDLIVMPVEYAGLVAEAAEQGQLPDAVTHRAVSPLSLPFTVLGRLFAALDAPVVPASFGLPLPPRRPRRYSDFALTWVDPARLDRVKAHNVVYTYHLAIRAAYGQPMETVGSHITRDSLTVWVTVHRGDDALFEGASPAFLAWCQRTVNEEDVT